MPLKVIISSLTVLVIIALGTISFQSIIGNPIIPHSSDLYCRDVDTGATLKVEGSCESVSDCKKWMQTNNCIKGNYCNNERLDCENNKCVSIIYFRWDKACV